MATLVIRRRNPYWLGVAASPLAFGAAVLGLAVAAKSNTNGLLLGFLAAAFALVGLFALRTVLQRNPGPVTGHEPVRCDERGLHVGDELLVAREAVRQGFVIPQRGLVLVRLECKGAPLPVELVAPSLEEARTVLATLGVDAAKTTTDTRIASRSVNQHSVSYALASVLGSFAAVMLLAAVVPHGLAVGVVAVVVIHVVLASVPTKIRVGVDGILLSWLGTSQFYPYADVLRVDTFDNVRRGYDESGLSLTLRNGKTERVIVGQYTWQRPVTALLVERIGEAVRTYHENHRDGGLESLDRGEQPGPAWLTALRRIGHSAQVDLRTPPVSTERLLEIVEDPGARPVLRVAAAVALAPRADAPRERVRVAAETSASPKLRVALQRAHDPAASDDALIEALEALEADERSRPVAP